MDNITENVAEPLMENKVVPYDPNQVNAVDPTVAKRSLARKLFETLSPAQAYFLACKKKFLWFCAGRGSGKTMVGSRYVYRKILGEKKAKGLICANTYDQLHSATLPPLYAFLNQMKMPFVVDKRPPESWGVPKILSNYRNVLVTKNGCHIFLRSLDNPEYIRGIEIAWAWIDEISSTTRDAWDIVIGCLRDPNGITLEIRVTGTPDHDNWTWQEFSKKWLPDTELMDDKETPINSLYDVVFMSTRDNPYLRKEFVMSLLASYSPEKAAQEVDGRVVMTNHSLVYYNYRKNFHKVKQRAYDPLRPLVLCLDFNAGGSAPMCAVICQVHSYIDGTEFVQVVAEIMIHNGNTQLVCDRFTEIFRGHFGGIEIYGDFQGKYRGTTLFGVSDFEYAKQRLSRNFPNVEYYLPKHNPSVDVRIGCLNAMLINALGDIRLFLDPSCKETELDFEKLRPENPMRNVEEEGGVQIKKKKHPNRSHLSDALGYFLALRFPMPSHGPQNYGSQDLHINMRI